MKKIYKGFIREIEPVGYEDRSEFISLDGENPISGLIMDDIDEHGDYLTVRYFISDIEKTIDELTENEIRKIVGDSTADFSNRYSETTGFLWTNMDIKVGGHNLLDEIESNMGKYICLEIEYNRKDSES